MMVSDRYHTPVLLHDCINGLEINKDGDYVDVTYGGGGHSREILKGLESGRLIAFDQDADAQSNKIDDDRLTLVKANFKFLKKNLRLNGLRVVDGILGDLGVSSYQFDEAERGFSFRFEGPLDMRMNQQVGPTAADILNSYSFEDLASVFRRYGEVPNPGKLAKAVIDFRQEESFKDTLQLKNLSLSMATFKKEKQYLSKVFQALRIEVNEEMRALEELLLQSVELLRVGGRLVIISYHSLEDRMVKNFFRSGNFEGRVGKDFYGNDIKPFRAISSKAIKATVEEIERNPRARSARLRIGERINEQTQKGKKIN